MAHFIYLFRNDWAPPKGPGGADMGDWGRFIETLRAGGHFVGGAPLGPGCSRRGAVTGEDVSTHIGGYMVITAESLQQATALLDACPAIARGGSVEVRELARE